MEGRRDDEPLTPIRWRTGAPAGQRGSLYQVIREHLWRLGGTCSRDELLKLMSSDASIRKRLHEGQGFARLLTNMRHSGEVLLDGKIVRATHRALRRGASKSDALNTPLPPT